jgi:hypothetical protein
MKYVYNDGGRNAAGFKGNAGDCVARAIAIAAEMPYEEVYQRLASGNAGQRVTKRTKASTARVETARSGIYTKRKWFRDYMGLLGFTWVPTMAIGSGCTVHLADGELPMGRLVVAISKHYCAVIDGVLNDTYDCSASRGVTIYPNGYTGERPKGAFRLANGNGWGYDPQRCVYGYWILNKLEG